MEYPKKLTTGSRYGIGLIGARQEGLFMRLNPFIWGAGAEFLTADGKRSAMDTPEFLEGFRYYVELFTKHKVDYPGRDRARGTGGPDPGRTREGLHGDRGPSRLPLILRRHQPEFQGQ